MPKIQHVLVLIVALARHGYGSDLRTDLAGALERALEAPHDLPTERSTSVIQALEALEAIEAIQEDAREATQEDARDFDLETKGGNGGGSGGSAGKGTSRSKAKGDVISKNALTKLDAKQKITGGTSNSLASDV